MNFKTLANQYVCDAPVYEIGNGTFRVFSTFLSKVSFLHTGLVNPNVSYLASTRQIPPNFHF